MQKSRRQLSDSQNFITERRLIGRITRLAGISREDTVLEIGTGKGPLTEALCERSGSVISIEIDRKLYESAGDRLTRYGNLTLTAAQNPPADIWLVMEKGAAKRFMGTPKETTRSLLLKANWKMNIAYHFRREDFHPMPSVDSVLVHFARKNTPDLKREEYREFQRFLEHSMKYGICGGRGLLTKRQVSVALKQAGLPQIETSGVTLYIQWLCLFRCWRKMNPQTRNTTNA